MNRYDLALKYVRGLGLEIAPGLSPWPNPCNAWIGYMGKGQVSVPLIDGDIETLNKTTDFLYDFLCASHVLEHLENPLGALKNWIRVLKPSGYLLLVIPEKNYTFDCTRKTTLLSHMIADNELLGFREQHKNEHWIEFASETKPPQRTLTAMVGEPDLGCHYHVFDIENTLDLLLYLKNILIFQIEVYALISKEIFVVLKKGESNAQRPLL
jgi:SAM-dependent methyltransferase